jgi:hypothetical protein
MTTPVEAYVKGLFNNRTSKDQAAPEPIFIGPGAWRQPYYHRKIKGAIAPEDIQALPNACLAGGGVDPNTCSPFSRPASRRGCRSVTSAPRW